MPVILRDYQDACIAACRAACVEGKRRLVASMPTGSGKTKMALSLVAGSLRKGMRVCWLLHLEELLDQTIESFEQVAPDLAHLVGVVKAERNDIDKQFTLASVQTLWGRDRTVEAERAKLDKALDECEPSEVDAIQAKLNALPPPSFPRWEALHPETLDFVVVDECHKAPSRSFTALLKQVPASSLILGLSATPFRGDNVSLAGVFTDGIAFNYPLKKAIREGHLCDFKYQSVWLDIDLSKIKTVAGEFSEKQLEEALERAGVSQATVEGIKQHAADRHGLIFTLTIRQGMETVDALRQNGFTAACISAETKKDERKRLVSEFKKGKIQFLASCTALSEGFDSPIADAVILARPTRSKTLYQQSCGRGFRNSKGKDDCLLLDFVGTDSKRLSAGVVDLIGISPRPGETSLDAEKRELKEAEALGLPSDAVAKAMLKAAEAASASRKAFEAAWVVLSHPPKDVTEGRVVAGSKGRKVIIWTSDPVEKNGQRLWKVAVWMAVQDGGKVFRLETKGVALDFAQNIGRQAMQDMSQNILMQSGATWRMRPASSKSLTFAKNLSVIVDPAWNAGEVSNAVNAVMCSRDLEKLLKGKQAELFFETPESFKEALRKERDAVEEELVEWRGKREANEVTA